MLDSVLQKYLNCCVKHGCIFAEDLLLHDELVELLPLVNGANAMAEELNKKVKFELALISPQARGLKDGRTEVSMRCTTF